MPKLDDVDRAMAILDPEKIEAKIAGLRREIARQEKALKMRREIDEMLGPAARAAEGKAPAGRAGTIADQAAEHLKALGSAASAADIGQAIGTTRDNVRFAMKKDRKRFRCSGKGRSTLWSLIK